MESRPIQIGLLGKERRFREDCSNLSKSLYGLREAIFHGYAL